jgi:nucleotide-binding universal stress UspA family protein
VGQAGQAPQATHEQEQKLKALLPPAAESQGRKVQVAVLTGSDSAATQIVKAAERLGVDVVCLGTYRRSGLARAVAGSVTRDVMAHTTRPVLVVRPPEG